jgi:hypothetical protein
MVIVNFIIATIATIAAIGTFVAATTFLLVLIKELVSPKQSH